MTPKQGRSPYSLFKDFFFKPLVDHLFFSMALRASQLGLSEQYQPYLIPLPTSQTMKKSRSRFKAQPVSFHLPD